jgi:hypothetical protein
MVSGKGSERVLIYHQWVDTSCKLRYFNFSECNPITTNDMNGSFAVVKGRELLKIDIESQ